MNDQDIRNFQMLRRAHVFCDVHQISFSPESLVHKTFVELGTLIAQIQTLAAEKAAASATKRQNTAIKSAAVETVRKKVDTIHRTARALAKTTPGIEDTFRLPHNANVQTLINTGRAFVQEAAPLEADFIEHEMPADFIISLTAALDTLEESIRQQEAAKGALKSATASIKVAIRRGLELVRIFDPLIRNKFADKPNVLSEWESARHIQRGPRSQPDDEDDDNNQPPTP